MDPTLKFSKDDGLLFENPERYRRLVGKLIYLTVTRLDLTLALGVVTQFMQNPRQDHWEDFYPILRYLKKSPGKGLFFKRKDPILSHGRRQLSLIGLAFRVEGTSLGSFCSHSWSMSNSS
ncbi:hypothetical protein CQW23_34479 [Capsicum baccatum]|uniref:Retrovirus-related Pol polyprotein from transposon TNT 1-94 n=1 Tax=Capsicum baccatum TaxID=33114 RepID=A0A2G2UZ38_CAPBA|nr:hypothetical protein CQW23_34479 [Capsicum baccatum]